MALWRWVQGRQGTGYVKMKLWSSKLLRCDCYRIKYFAGAYIPAHTDPSPVPGTVHHRLNVELKSTDCRGGDFLINGAQARPIFQYGRLQVFHFLSSEETHEVTEVTEGRRKVLSFGWLTKTKTQSQQVHPL